MNTQDSKNYEKKLKSPFMVCADAANLVEPEDNRKQNPEE